MPAIRFYTFGCKVNQTETQSVIDKMPGGYWIADDNSEADILFINSCTVTSEADRQCRQLIRSYCRVNPRGIVVLTGCYAERATEVLQSEFPAVRIIKKNECGDFWDIIEKYSAEDVSQKQRVSAGFANVRSYVKVQDGCNQFCSYCIVPYVRPILSSRKTEDVLSEVKRKVDTGVKEIVLTGIRLGKYKSGSCGLVNLIDKVTQVNGIQRVRLSSIELIEVSDELLRLIKKNTKLCRHLHIPVQHCHNDVLKAMNRPYFIEEFVEKIAKVREQIPDCGITTDVITGFPAETLGKFEDSFRVLKKIGFSRLHVFRYSPREGTLAYQTMKDCVDNKEKKRRSKVLLQLDLELRQKFAEKFVGTRVEVLLENKRSAGNGYIFGYSGNYIEVFVDTDSVNTLCSAIIVKIEKGRAIARI